MNRVKKKKGILYFVSVSTLTGKIGIGNERSSLVLNFLHSAEFMGV